jgi:uncharacterized repeat protein (TIGR03803 family)
MTRTRQVLGTRWRAVRIALALAIVLVPTVVEAQSAEGRIFKVLYSFRGGADGYYPYDGLTQDAAGNLYGTTAYGGTGCNGLGCGVVFKVDKTGKETLLHRFTGTVTGTGGDGEEPLAGLVRDANGNLYGTTAWGGNPNCNFGSGCGVVFKLDKAGKETVLYSFTGFTEGSDGENPEAGLVRDAAGNLYGTTRWGGSGVCEYGCGVVFKLDKTGKETVLYSFTGTGGDGASPLAGLVRDVNGNLYGTTWLGGTSNYGTVFKVDKTGKETVLHSFTGGADGGWPQLGYLVRDAAGNLYGTTWLGGDLSCRRSFGCGVVFKLGKTGKETVLYSFTGTGGDGENPIAGLVRDAKGNLYGTTGGGGAYGYGTVFKLDKTGKETVLHSFDPQTDGGWPNAGLIGDAAGNLYGTANLGGAYGYGTVYKLTP